MDTQAFVIGYDKASAAGDRSALSIGLTPDQYAAVQRANVPPGDAEGAKILEEIDRIETAFRKEFPNVTCRLFVLNNVSATIRGEETKEGG